MKYRVFFAWQSQNKNTERYVKKELSRAKKELASEDKEIDLIFSPTQDETGSPDIKVYILEQIKSCDIFVGDLSFIDVEKGISNGNVLYETGIADAFLGEERVILVCDENTEIERIAFDINHKRISKVDTRKGQSGLVHWVRAALEESDRQRYIKTYANSQYEEEINILFNHFYRYINMSQKKYCSELCIPKNEQIIENLLSSSFPYFFLHTDFTELINELEEKMLRLNQFSHKRVVWCVMNIITRLKTYQKYCKQTRYAFFYVSDSETLQYNVYDAKNFYLKEGYNFSDDVKTVLFSNNSEIIMGELGMLVMDKRIYVNSEKHYRRESLAMGVGSQMVISTKMVTIEEEKAPIIARLVSDILVSIVEYINFCNLKLRLEADTLITIE